LKEEREMKKGILITMLMALIAGISMANIHFVSADDDMKGGMMGGGMMGGKGGMMGMMGGKEGMMGMKGMMMMKMMHPDVVATSDGGIVILQGNKLTKYDKNLNVVKEVEIKMPSMDEMKKMCPMMGKGMMEDGMAEDAATADPAEKAEHEAHHPENK
jgi:hypothetical protein